MTREKEKSMKEKCGRDAFCLVFNIVLPCKWPNLRENVQ